MDIRDIPILARVPYGTFVKLFTVAPFLLEIGICVNTWAVVARAPTMNEGSAAIEPAPSQRLESGQFQISGHAQDIVEIPAHRDGPIPNI
jgi:hypothetical protein